MEKTQKVKQTEYFGVENGDCLSRMPAATADQLNIAKILSKPGDDVNLKLYVAQIRELTECTEDQAVTALYDCENNLERAVGLLLDKFRCGVEEEWHTTGKKPRQKHVPSDISECGLQEPVSEKSLSDRVQPQKNGHGSTKCDTKPHKVEDAETLPRRKDNRVRRIPGTKSEHIDHNNEIPELKYGSRSNAVDSNPKHVKTRSKISSNSDGWDPYTEYGEWGGEAIEIVNSNSTIACGMPAEVALPDGLFVDTESTGSKAPRNLPSADDILCSPSSELSSKLANMSDPDAIFVSKAVSKPPPSAFKNLPDTPVFIIPDLLPDVSSQWRFVFNGEPCTPLRHNQKPVVTPAHTPKEHLLSDHSQSGLAVGAKNLSDMESQGYSPYVPSPPCKPSAAALEMSKSSGTRSLLKNPPQSDKQEAVGTSFSNDHYQNSAVASKVFSNSAKPQNSTAYDSERSNSQTGFLESSLKNYILDNLPTEMNKLSVNDSTSQNAKSSHFNLQASSAQTQPSVNPSFPHPQGSGGTSLQHQLNKAALSHNSLHGSQQPLVSSASQTHHQPTTTLPPGMPQFISQFGPAYHMFNLPGSSSNTPALFDIDQLQLLQQQQRMLYDMHLQQQAATTAQSLLTSSSEAPSTAKSVAHSMPGTLNHVTATNAGIRPDMLTPAMGPTPQMMPPGHPYFSYPGFVVMNGYTNAFLNQQQQQSAQDNSQNQGPRHAGSPIAPQHPSQPTNSQSYSGLKPGNTGVPGYEDLFDMKYGDPNKQVGFKTGSNQPNFNSFQGQILAADNFGGKLPTGTHTAGGILAQNFNASSGAAPQPFSPQFYPSSPHITAAAFAVAAAAAVSAQQQSSNNAGAVAGAVNQANAVGPTGSNASTQGGGGAGNPNQMHLSGNPTQSMVMGSTGQGLHHHPHHQRPVMPHQH